MSFNARLFNLPKLREIVEVTDEISDWCQTTADNLADYEGADELTGAEKTETRNDARQNAWESIEEILTNAERLRELRDSVFMPDTEET